MNVLHNRICVLCGENRAIYAIQRTFIGEGKPVTRKNFQPVYIPQLCEKCVKGGLPPQGCIVAKDGYEALKLILEQHSGNIYPFEWPFIIIESKRARRFDT